MTKRYAAPLLAALGIVGAIGLAAPASARPECVNTGPTTTQCSTNGSSSITTSPPATNFSPWGVGWPYGGGLILSLG